MEDEFLVVRRNGLQRPFAMAQIAHWLLVCVIAMVFFGNVCPNLAGNYALVVSASIGAAALLVLGLFELALMFMPNHDRRVDIHGHRPRFEEFICNRRIQNLECYTCEVYV